MDDGMCGTLGVQNKCHMNTNFKEKAGVVYSTVRFLLTKWSMGRELETAIITVWKYNPFNWIYLGRILSLSGKQNQI